MARDNDEAVTEEHSNTDPSAPERMVVDGGRKKGRVTTAVELAELAKEKAHKAEAAAEAAKKEAEEAKRRAEEAEDDDDIEKAKIRSETIKVVVNKVFDFKVLIPTGFFLLMLVGILAGVYTDTFDFQSFVDWATGATEKVPGVGN